MVFLLFSRSDLFSVNVPGKSFDLRYVKQK